MVTKNATTMPATAMPTPLDPPPRSGASVVAFPRHAASLSVPGGFSAGGNPTDGFQEDLRSRRRTMRRRKNVRRPSCGGDNPKAASLSLALLRQLLVDGACAHAWHRYGPHLNGRHPPWGFASVFRRCRRRRRSRRPPRRVPPDPAVRHRRVGGARRGVRRSVRVQRRALAPRIRCRHAADDLPRCEGLREGDVRLRQ